MTVLSTSKKAAAEGSASIDRALSTSAIEAAASPASWDRRTRFGGAGRRFRDDLRPDLLPGFRDGGGGVTRPP